MKSFRFPLDPVLRWRETQRELRKAALSAAAGKLARIESRRAALQAECAAEAARFVSGITTYGAALASFDGFAVRTKRQIEALEKQTREARDALAAERKRLAEADRAVRLIENVREDRFNQWRREFERQEGVFADEAFLVRLSSRGGNRG